MTQDECIAEMRKHFGRKATAWEGICGRVKSPEIKVGITCEFPDHGENCPGRMPVYSVAEMSEIIIDQDYSYAVPGLARGATWEAALDNALCRPLRPPFVIPLTCMEHYQTFITAPTDEPRAGRGQR